MVVGVGSTPPHQFIIVEPGDHGDIIRVIFKSNVWGTGNVTDVEHENLRFQDGTQIPRWNTDVSGSLLLVAENDLGSTSSVVSLNLAWNTISITLDRIERRLPGNVELLPRLTIT